MINAYEEPCPNCEELVGISNPIIFGHLETTCPYCGEVLMICSACPDTNCCDWREGCGCHMDKAHFNFETSKYFEIETYPDMFVDYDKGIENDNYNNEIRIFSVPMVWALEYIDKHYHMNLDEFKNEYDWDMTYQMYCDALNEDEIVSNTICERN